MSLLSHLGFAVKRAWGSDGRSINEKSDVDVSARKDELNLKVQVKRRKKIPNYFDLGNANVLAVRADRGEWLFCFPESMLEEIL